MRHRPSIPNWVLALAKASALALLVWLLWRAVDWRASLDLLRAAELHWLALAALVLTAQTLLSALRWRLTAGQLGIRLSPAEAVREYYLSQAVNQSLPGGVAGDASRAVRARRQAGLLASGQAVLFERLAGQLGLLVLLCVGLVTVIAVPGGYPWPLWLTLAVATGFGLLFSTLVALALVRNLGGTGPSRIQGFVSAFAKAVWAPEVRSAQIVLSLSTAICNVAAFALCGLALGIPLSLLATVTIVPLILFAMLIPLSISGWGVREGAAAALFPVLGATMSEGLAVSIAFGLVFLATVIPGLALSWLRPNRLGLSRP